MALEESHSEKLSQAESATIHVEHRRKEQCFLLVLVHLCKMVSHHELKKKSCRFGEVNERLVSSLAIGTGKVSGILVVHRQVCDH